MSSLLQWPVLSSCTIFPFCIIFHTAARKSILTGTSDHVTTLVKSLQGHLCAIKTKSQILNMTRKTPQGLAAICFYSFPALVTLPTMFYHTLIHHTFLLFHQCFSGPGRLTPQVSESERSPLASLHPTALLGKAVSPCLLMTCYFSALHLFFIVVHL